MYIVCLTVALIGIVFIIMSIIHRHKGMWEFHNYRDWLHNPRWTRRGIETPLDETYIGIELILIALIVGIQNSFGLRASAWAMSAAGIGSGIFCIIMTKRDGDEQRYFAGAIVSGCVFFLGMFILFLT